MAFYAVPGGGGGLTAMGGGIIVPFNVNVTQYAGNAVASAGANGVFAVGGNTAAGAAYTSFPLGISGLANTDAAMPVDVAANTGVRIAADLKGRTHINLGTIRGTEAVQGGVNGLLGVGGAVADDVAAAANPVTIGGVWIAPLTAITAVGRVGSLVVDEFRRLRITGQTEHRNPYLDISPVAVGGYADVTYTAAPAADGTLCRFVSNAKGWQRIEAYGPTLDAAVPVIAANYPLPISGLYTAAPVAALADGAQGTIAVDARRMLRIVGGDNADDSAQASTWPVKMGGVAAADPTLSTLSAAGDISHALFDLNRYLYTHDKTYDATSMSNRVFEVAPLNLQVVEESLVDTANHAVSAGINYPSDDGIVMMGYKDIALTGKFICGTVDNTVTLTVEGTNDEDATPANRDWIPVYGWRSDTNGVVNSIANPISTMTTFGWDFDEWDYRYFRIHLVITGTIISNTIIVKERRKAL